MNIRILLIILFCLIGSITLSQTFPKIKDLSTGQGSIGNLDPNWQVSDWFPLTSPIPNPLLINYNKATINVNCSPGAWVDPLSLPSPVNNGNWITSDENTSCISNTNFGYRFYRLTLNLPALCNGQPLDGTYKLFFTGYVDNEIKDVYVNGVAKAIHGGSYSAGGKIDFELDGPWKSGINYVDVLLWNYDIGGSINPYGLLLVADYSKSSSSDMDGDGVVDIIDDCPCMAGDQMNGCGKDSDGDLISDAFDIDDDNDGIPDNIEQYPNCDASKVYNWVKWTTIGDKTAVGEINVNGRVITATVTQSNGGMLQTSGMFSGGVFPTNLGVPVNDQSIANSLAGIFTITFSEPISTPLFAFASVGNPGVIVPVTTSFPYNVVWAGQGVTYSSTTEFRGQEGYNLIQIPRVGTTFTFNYQTSEYYCNIAFGVKDILNCSGPPLDTDNDGVPNYLDLDSDGDGCSDAFESGATTNKTPGFVFQGPYGKNGLSDVVEFPGDDGVLKYTITYNQLALNKLAGDCAIIDSDGDGIEDEDDIDDDNDGVLDIDEGVCTSEYQGFVPTSFQIYKYDLGKGDYLTPTKSLPSNKLALVATYTTPNPGRIDWPTTVASDHIKTYVPANMISYRNGYNNEPNVNITIFRVIVPKGYKNVSQSITRFGVDGGTNIWKNGVLIDGMCCGDEGGPPAPITTTYFVNSGDTIEFRSVNGIPVHQGTKFEFTQIKGKCVMPDDIDTDGDGIVNRLDTDSDGDGCSDAFESGATLDKDPSSFRFKGQFGKNGYKDSLEVNIESGLINYKLTYNYAIDSTYSMCGCSFDDKGMFAKDTLAFCGISALLDPGSGYKYRWSDGTNAQLGIISNSGKTFVHISKIACNYTDTLFIYLLTPRFTFKDSVICKGNSIDLIVDTSHWSLYPNLIPTIFWNGSNNLYKMSVSPKNDTLIYCSLKNKLLACKDSISITLHEGKAKLTQMNVPYCWEDSISILSDTAKNYSWNFPGITRVIKVPSTTKKVVVDVIDTVGCQANFTLNLDYNLSPIYFNSIQTDITCYGQHNGSIVIHPIGGIPSYNYTWPDGSLLNSITNLDTGKVILKLIDANGCKKDTVFQIHEPNDSISIKLSQIDVLCKGDNTGRIDAAVKGGTIPYQYLWSNQSQNEDIDKLYEGLYTLQVTDANGCKNNRSIKLGYQYNKPIIKAGNNQSVCFGDSVFLNASGGVSYQWSPVGIDLKYVKPLLGSNYYIVDGKDINGCTSKDSILLEAYNLPIVDAGKDQQFCEGQETSLNASGNAITYFWSNPIIDGQVFKPQVGISTFILTGFDFNGCKSVDTVKIRVDKYPVLSFTSTDTLGCPPLKVDLLFKSNPIPDKFVWNINGVYSDSISNPLSYVFNKEGCYSIGLTATKGICSTKKNKDSMVCVIEKPTALFTADTTFVEVYAPIVQFTNFSTNADKYLWKFGDNSISTLTSPSHTFINKVADNTVTLYALKDYVNCVDSHIVVINIVDEIILYCPNTFTPDSDKINEIFRPIITAGVELSSYNLQIYDRWGLLVFESYDVSSGWNGTYGGIELAPDTYTYVISFVDRIKGKAHKIHGHVNLLR